MKQRIKTERDKKNFRRKVLSWSKRAGVAIVVLLVALAGVFFPFQSLLPAYQIEPRKEGELRIHFLDAGEGDCSIVEFPGGALLVIDAGDGNFDSNNRILRYMKGLRYTSLSYVVTHASGDHCGGMPRIVSCYGADTVYLPAVESSDRVYQNFKRISAKNAREIKTLMRYAAIDDPSGAYLVCLSPYHTDETGENDSSAVLYLSYKGVRVLFAGDISSVRERRLLRDYALTENVFDSGDRRVKLEKINLIKASNHGAESSSCTEWLRLLAPENAVISCGKGNRYAHPAHGTIERFTGAGAKIFRTDELGTLVMSITDAGYRVD